MCTRVSGKTIKRMAMATINISGAVGMKEIGSRIFSMEKDIKNSLTVLCSQDFINKDSNMAKEK